ncbi:MAG: hypothetical protein RM347_031955 [Nostoc sp. ChiQUE02]|uniref:hypothetical protein n=1 Tax=Nostoc sp. ChiQUE02 TaxID=3075377 RepID=UPI002AD5A07A|nr:hypothetical protein [Nostoc sp. ChiQUE02]MDZ8233602.1 hypothetical protein [Nostoc sp. ChiQUE02]
MRLQIREDQIADPKIVEEINQLKSQLAERLRLFSNLAKQHSLIEKQKEIDFSEKFEKKYLDLNHFL